MSKHNLHKEIEKIKKRILSLGAMVEERVQQARRIIASRDTEASDKLIGSDYEIDALEVDVEEECLKILALYQPVAVDLRFLVAVIKINNDLERIADEAVNIAMRVKYMTLSPELKYCIDYSEMIAKAQAMLRLSLESLVNLDVDLALKVCMMDDEVDLMHSRNYDRIVDLMQKDPAQIRSLLNMFLISRHLERIADHTTNIGEEVAYMVEGEIVRHEIKK